MSKWLLATTCALLLATTHSSRAEAILPKPQGKLEFAIPDRQGTLHKLSEWQGTPVLINFWASWCGPCRSELPDLQEIARQQAGKLTVIGVNLTKQDDPDAAEALLMEHGITYPNLYDALGEVAERNRISVIPTSFLLDRNGVIRHKFYGPITMARIKPFLDGHNGTL